MNPENVALFDMDGTLCDYVGQLSEDLKKLAAPGESDFVGELKDAPSHIKIRADIIRSSQEWWKNIPRLQSGWDILKVAKDL